MTEEGKSNREHKSSFLKKIIAIYELSLRDERVTIPLMKTIEMLLNSDYLSDEGLDEDFLRIHALSV